MVPVVQNASSSCVTPGFLLLSSTARSTSIRSRPRKDGRTGAWTSSRKHSLSLWSTPRPIYAGSRAGKRLQEVWAVPGRARSSPSSCTTPKGTIMGSHKAPAK